jgi:hypothetical protein
VRFDVSNVPGGFVGAEISQVGGWPSWPSGVAGEAAASTLRETSSASLAEVEWKAKKGCQCKHERRQNVTIEVSN